MSVQDHNEPCQDDLDQDNNDNNCIADEDTIESTAENLLHINTEILCPSSYNVNQSFETGILLKENDFTSIQENQDDCRRQNSIPFCENEYNVLLDGDLNSPQEECDSMDQFMKDPTVYTGTSLPVSSPFLGSTHSVMTNNGVSDDASKIISDFCQQPGVVSEMIDILHKDIERDYSLINFLKTFRGMQSHMWNTQGFKMDMEQTINADAQFLQGLLEPKVYTVLSSDHILPLNSVTKQDIHTKANVDSPQQLVNIIPNGDDHCVPENTTTIEDLQNADINRHGTEGSIAINDKEAARSNELASSYEDNNNSTSCSTEQSENHQKVADPARRNGFEKLYKCADCNFRTNHRKNLNGHLISHHKKGILGLKTFSCNFCDYKCVDKQRFNEHELTHTRVKNFTCADCEKQFSTKRGLRTHMKYHSNERPHTCPLCNASFKVKGKLRDHVKLVHTNKGEKPYKCGYCHHRASVRGNVNQHIKHMHKGKAILVTVIENKKHKLQ